MIVMDWALIEIRAPGFRDATGTAVLRFVKKRGPILVLMTISSSVKRCNTSAVSYPGSRDAVSIFSASAVSCVVLCSWKRASFSCSSTVFSFKTRE